MATVTPKASTQPEAPPKTSRTWLIILITVAVIAIVAVGVWAITDANQSDDAELTRATEIMDQWSEAWNSDDPQSMVALFTEDGIFLTHYVVWPSTFDGEDVYRGRSEIGTFVEIVDHRVVKAERLGEGTRTIGGTFTFPWRFDYEGEMQVGLIAVELDGDLASRIEHVWMLDAQSSFAD